MDFYELVIRSRSGDIEAFGEIVDRFQDMAVGYAYSVLGDFHLAEDASQEAFVQAYRNLLKLRDANAFPGWFRQIVFGCSQRVARHRGTAAAPLEPEPTLAATGPDPSESLEARETKEQVLAAVWALPEGQRTATTLFYINGYSQRDISAFLDVPVTTVKNRLYDARKTLKRRMIAMVKKALHERAPAEGLRKKVFADMVKAKQSVHEALGGFPVMETARLRLREMRLPEDAEVWLSTRVNPTEMPDCEFPQKSVDALAKAMKRGRENWYKPVYYLYWAAANKDDDRIVGHLRFWEWMGHWSCPWGFGTLNYELDKDHWDNGYGSEILRAAGEFGVRTLRLGRVQCSISPRDAVRARELEAAGFTNEGVHRCWWFDPGTKQWQDELLFSFVEADLDA